MTRPCHVIAANAPPRLLAQTTVLLLATTVSVTGSGSSAPSSVAPGRSSRPSGPIKRQWATPSAAAARSASPRRASARPTAASSRVPPARLTTRTSGMAGEPAGPGRRPSPDLRSARLPHPAQHARGPGHARGACTWLRALTSVLQKAPFSQIHQLSKATPFRKPSLLKRHRYSKTTLFQKPPFFSKSAFFETHRFSKAAVFQEASFSNGRVFPKPWFFKGHRSSNATLFQKP